MIDELLRIADLAGAELLALQEDVLGHMRERGPYQEKGLGDFATEADLAAERLILKQLERSFPGVPVVAEESFGTGELPPTYITVDPLDGTIIYSRGCKEWGATICFVEDGQPQAGVIVFPAIGVRLTAVSGEGCFVNGERMEVKPRDASERFILAIDTFYNTKAHEISGVMLPLVEQGRILVSRSIGSAVGNTLALLNGEVDVYYCARAKVWDVAAAALALVEAGGFVAPISENPYNWRMLPKGQIFGCTEPLAEEVAALARNSFRDHE